MSRRTVVTFGGLLALVVVSLLAWGAATQAAPGATAHPIRLQVATFTPAAGEMPPAAPGLAVAEYAPGTRGYYIVQFDGPVRAAWKNQVTKLGGELLDYVPDYAFKVRLTPVQAAEVRRLASVAWVGVFQPAFKIAPSVAVTTDGATSDGATTNGVAGGPARLLRVRVERGADAAQATAAIARSGAVVLDRSLDILLVGADPAQIRAIANVLDVAWIEPFAMPEKHNEYGAGGIVGANTANANGYDGSTQIAAVADTGIGGGTTTTAHPDIPAARVANIYNWPGAAGGCFQTLTNDGAIDVDSGHGTHTAASVLSDGGPSGEGKGGAPAARLVFQATENWVTVSNYCQIVGGYPPNGYFLTGLPADLRNLYQQAYNAGARIHSNSWGAALAGDYTLNSANTDSFVWTNRDMTITFSAGNSGIDANGNGVVDNDSIGSPATAKNVITVGASENARADNFPCDTGLGYTSSDAYQSGQTCASMGGVNLLGTWGQRYGTSFPTNPLKDDLTAGNANQMASWSSRGPADDGRIKPDVVAPGTWILSGTSGLYRQGYGGATNPQNGAYQYDGWGMPLTADYKYMGGTSMSNPIAAGAATVVRDYYQKAHSLNASAALVKATLINTAVDLADENNDGANDNDFPIPNVHEGWGRINVAAATDGSRQFVDNTTGIGTGGSAAYNFNVGTAGQPFKVTLVWSDYPSTETAALNLVNNLNLVVTAPGGTVYRGNVFSGGWSATGGSADTVNNVENVYVQSAAAGNWSISVQGANVPNGPQPFALVISGNATAGPTPTSTSVPPTPTQTPIPPTPTNTPAAVVMHVGDLDGSSANTSSSRWRATVTIAVHDAAHGIVSGATVTGTWSNGSSGSSSCTTNASGVCSVTKTNLRRNNTASVRFTITNVTKSGATYSSAANHDVDGGTNGTFIVVNRP